MLKAIETRYGGYKFRSRLEARWAVFFDALNVRYEYEAEGYDLGELGWYLPDFWLPDLQCWVEIKGEKPGPDSLESAKLLKLHTQSGHPAFLFWGEVGNHLGLAAITEVSDSGGGACVIEDIAGWGINESGKPVLYIYGLEKREYFDFNHMKTSVINVNDPKAEFVFNHSPKLDIAVESAKSARFEFGQHESVTRTLAESTQNVIDYIGHVFDNGEPDKISTGFVELDEILGGFHPSDLIVLAARPEMGKTSLGLSFAAAAAKVGKSVGIFNLEMSSEQISTQLLSAHSRVDGNRLRDGNIYEDEWPILLECAQKIAKYEIHIDTASTIFPQIYDQATHWHSKHGLDLLVIDYIQLMSSGTHRQNNRQQEMSSLSRSFKWLARELHIPVIVLSQLERGGERRVDGTPLLSNLNDSLHQDADVVMFIYREDYYIEDTDRRNIADIIVAKHRHGGTGTGSLYFRKEFTQFCNVEVNRVEL